MSSLHGSLVCATRFVRLCGFYEVRSRHVCLSRLRVARLESGSSLLRRSLCLFSICILCLLLTGLAPLFGWMVASSGGCTQAACRCWKPGLVRTQLGCRRSLWSCAWPINPRRLGGHSVLAASAVVFCVLLRSRPSSVCPNHCGKCSPRWCERLVIRGDMSVLLSLI